MENDLVLIPMYDEHRTGDCPRQPLRFSPVESRGALCRDQHLRGRLEAPVDRILDGLGRVRLGKHAAEEGFEKAAMILEPVVGVELLPAVVFVADVIEGDVDRLSAAATARAGRRDR